MTYYLIFLTANPFSSIINETFTPSNKTVAVSILYSFYFNGIVCYSETFTFFPNNNFIKNYFAYNA